MSSFPAPYAPPAASLSTDGHSAASRSMDCGISIEGSKLVVPDGYIFPPICPFTGEVTGLGIATNRRVSAHEKWIYLLLLLGLLPYIIVAVCCAQKGTFNCRLSDKVTSRWRFYRIIGTIAFFGSFFIFFAGASRQSIGLLFLALVMLIGGLCTACGMFNGIKASAVRNGKIWLLGMPRAVREKIVEIEQKRLVASERAARAQAAAAAAATGLPAPCPVPYSAPPPVPAMPGPIAPAVPAYYAPQPPPLHG